MIEHVILVDADDVVVGTEEKLRAHREAKLHRAFSVFTFNSRGEILLQRRARGKYHSGGLWSNTCCSHPRPGESVEKAAQRRLIEEMGFRCELDKAFAFIYVAPMGGGLWEHEHDHVLIGRCDAKPKPDPVEVEAWRWEPIQAIHEELARSPERFTVWFRMIFERLMSSRHGA